VTNNLRQQIILRNPGEGGSECSWTKAVTFGVTELMVKCSV